MSTMRIAAKSLGLERVHYFPRQLITPEDMIAEQEYFRQKMRRHNRFLHGWGVVCGLAVEPAPENGKPWQVRVESGYALSPQGDEIYLPEPVCIDLVKCGLESASAPCQPAGGAAVVPVGNFYLAIRYLERMVRPVRVHPAGCNCDDAACEYSRIEEGFEIECLDTLPKTHQAPASAPLPCEMLKKSQLSDCPPCPEEPWVVLAQIRWPATSSTNIANGDITNCIRRQLFSTASIQAQVIEFCSGKTGYEVSQPTSSAARIVEVTPGNNTTLQNKLPPQVLLRFDRPMDPNTINPNTVQIWYVIRKRSRTTPSQSLPVQVSYDAASQTAAVSSLEDPFNASVSIANGDIIILDIKAFGEGAEFIQDSTGKALDGNGDGTPGGVFQSQFLILVNFQLMAVP